jgi:hypothetical protein
MSNLSVKEGTTNQTHVDQDGRPLGSSRMASHRTASGSVTYTVADYAKITDAHCIRAFHVFETDYGFFETNGIDGKNEAHQPINVTMDLIESVNPILKSLLSAEGNHKRFTHATGTSWTHQIVAVNTRPGATVTYELENAPAGCTVNAATGLITFTTPAAGKYNFTAICKDVSGEDFEDERDAVGDAGIYLTVTA